VTIHSSHPFPTEDDPVRRLRGRLGGQVSLWTTGSPGGSASDRAGLTVSSLMVAGGEPARAIGLVDPDSDLAERLAVGSPVVVQLLAWRHRMLAEAFAGVAPAPGGPFTTGDFADTPWGPRLVDAGTWLGARVESIEQRGWSVLVTAAVEEVSIDDDEAGGGPLLHRRGRYHRLGTDHG